VCVCVSTCATSQWTWIFAAAAATTRLLLYYTTLLQEERRKQASKISKSKIWQEEAEGLCGGGKRKRERVLLFVSYPPHNTQACQLHIILGHVLVCRDDRERYVCVCNINTTHTHRHIIITSADRHLVGWFGLVGCEKGEIFNRQHKNRQSARWGGVACHLAS
jgi:hypothetical protein